MNRVNIWVFRELVFRFLFGLHFVSAVSGYFFATTSSSMGLFTRPSPDIMIKTQVAFGSIAVFPVKPVKYEVCLNFKRICDVIKF